MGASIHDIKEEAVVRGCLEDEALAAEAFCRTFRPRLMRLLKNRVGDDGLAEDLAQEALLKALRGLDGFDPRRPLWPWLRTIALNLAIDHTRKGEPEVPCRNIYRSSEDPLERTDESLLLDQALRTLPGRHRAALSLRYLNDWKPTEAAQFLGMSRPAFDQLLSRAKRRLGVEYRRMSSGLQAILVLQGERLRSGLHERTARLSRRVQGISTEISPSVMTSVSQVLTATAVVITTTVAHHAPAPPIAPGGGLFTAADPGTAPTAGKNISRDTGKGGHGSIGTAPAGSGGGVSSSPHLRTADGGPKSLGQKKDEIIDPTRDVDDPEDATIISFAFGSEDGSVAYAAGRAHCRTAVCPPVLFGSKDGGRTWTRLPANGLSGTEIAAPSDGLGDDILFAMGSSGLQVSRDGGASFSPALASGTPMITGSMAVSPEFNGTDPIVLVGADTLFRYSDSTGIMDPYPNSLNGPFEPAFSADYDSSGTFYLGALKTNGAGGMRSVIYMCDLEGCYSKGLPVRDQLPQVRPVTARPDLIFAFTENELFTSSGSDIRFNRIALPWSEPTLLDIRPLHNGMRLLAATASVKPSSEDGVYASKDGGDNWITVRSSLFRSGATAIANKGSRVLVALRDRGFACSSDGGATFARRC
ncbi:MAG: sigma-70 family RNA polymerase sigma factor [Actinomycetota bacterium]